MKRMRPIKNAVADATAQERHAMGMGMPGVFLLQAVCKTACLCLEPFAFNQP